MNAVPPKSTEDLMVRLHTAVTTPILTRDINRKILCDSYHLPQNGTPTVKCQRKTVTGTK
jgi:hypothetical protein